MRGFGNPKKYGIEFNTYLGILSSQFCLCWQNWLSCLVKEFYATFAEISKNTHSGPPIFQPEKVLFTVLYFMLNSCSAYCELAKYHEKLRLYNNGKKSQGALFQISQHTQLHISQFMVKYLSKEFTYAYHSNNMIISQCFGNQKSAKFCRPPLFNLKRTD